MSQTLTPEEESVLGSASSPEPGRPPALAPPSGVGGPSMQGPFDGADRLSRAAAMWEPNLQSADNDILPEKGVIDARARDILRNDAYVAGGSNIHKDNIVGALFALNAKPILPVLKELGLTEDWASKFQEEAESKFTLWAESPNGWADASRMNTLTGLVRLAIGIYVASGEVLSTVEWIRRGGRPYRTAIQMVSVDRLCTPYEKQWDPNVKGGIQKNRWGESVGYYIQTVHPGDFRDPRRLQYKFVPAAKPWGRAQVLHFFEQSRPDQTRGISEMVTALKESRTTKKFRDVVLQNAVVNATFAASIESELPPEAVFAAIGGGNMDATQVEQTVQSYASGYLSAIAAYTDGSRNMALDGVKIPHLYPGTKLQLRGAGQGGPLGTEFEQSLLRYISSALGVSYEQLSKDYSSTNYSSARAAMNETHKFMASRKKMIADRFATAIYRLWLEEAINNGHLTTVPAAVAANLYTNGTLNMNFEALAACDWIGASRGQIDELKETQAAVLRLKFNLSTHEQELSRLGQDWRTVFAQREREKKDLEARGLEPDPEDNQINAVSGAPREKDPGTGGDKDPDEDKTDG